MVLVAFQYKLLIGEDMVSTAAAFTCCGSPFMRSSLAVFDALTALCLSFCYPQCQPHGLLREPVGKSFMKPD